MNILEKILEEIKDLKEKQNSSNQDYATGYLSALSTVEGIISGVKENDGWIPVEEKLPEEEDSMFAQFKGTDKWGNAMFEKKSDEVNITYELEDGTRKTGTSYTLDGKWKIEINNRVVKKKVIAWQPLPKEYKGE